MKKQYKAKETFVGVISMQKGEIKKMDKDNMHVQDLLKAKLIEEVKVTRPRTKKK